MALRPVGVLVGGTGNPGEIWGDIHLRKIIIKGKWWGGWTGGLGSRW